MLKVVELFAGIGSQTQALKNLGIEHKIMGIAEIDKYAVKSYEAIHGEVNNLGDICKIEQLPGCDLLTYSFPCQDISVAGKGAGIKEGTRSGLLLEVERLLEVSDKPKYLLMENVKNLVGKKNKADFDRWCEKLESMGYVNYWKVLNAKHYGIPQNRERVFMVSILGEHDPYMFPDGFDNGIRLKDMLEDEVDEKYYISNEKAEKLISQFKINTNEEFLIGGEQKNQTVKYDGIGTTLTSSMGCGGGYVPMLMVKQATKQGFAVAMGVAIPCLTPVALTEKRTEEAKKIRRENMKNGIDWSPRRAKELVPRNDNYSNCLTTGLTKEHLVLEPKVMSKEATKQGGYRQPSTLLNDYRIRKLTPLECWRLMGFKDEQFEKAQQVNSNSQLYKQAGNSIVVDVLEHIFTNLFIVQED